MKWDSLFDSADYAPADRIEATRNFLSDFWTTDIEFDRAAPELTFKIQYLQFGPLGFSRTISNGLHSRYTAPPDLRDEQRTMALVLHQGEADGQFTQGDRRLRLRRSGDANLNDLSQTYDLRWSGVGSSTGVMLDLDYAGLGIEDLRNALAPEVLATPVARMALHHVRYLVRNFDQLSHLDAEADHIIRTTTDLMRAVVSQVPRTDGSRTDAWHDTEVSRLLAYARQHLQDHDLSASSIAAAHHMSERHLYRQLERAGIGLTDWIIGLRLERCRAQLADPLNALSIDAVAGQWGFQSAAHFSRRFKAQFGQTPSQWRRASRGATEVRRAP